MIPPGDEGGDLPPGLHTATWIEFRDRFYRFVQSDRRLQHCRNLSQLIEDAGASTIVTRILVGGSMVSTKAEPNDFDCIVILKDTVDYGSLRPDHMWVADGQRARQRYKGDIFIVREGQLALALYVDFFSHNRHGKLVGLIRGSRMITDQAQLEVTQEQLRRLELALAELRRSTDETEFRCQSPPVIDHIKRLCSEIDEYLGIREAESAA